MNRWYILMVWRETYCYKMHTEWLPSCLYSLCPLFPSFCVILGFSVQIKQIGKDTLIFPFLNMNGIGLWTLLFSVNHCSYSFSHVRAQGAFHLLHMSTVLLCGELRVCLTSYLGMNIWDLTRQCNHEWLYTHILSYVINSQKWGVWVKEQVHMRL